MNVSVLIATFGSEQWMETRKRAIRSVEQQGFHNWVMYHDPDGTICSVRNQTAKHATGDWLCFLDADDELAPGFMGAIRRALEQEQGTDGNQYRLLFAPAIQTSPARKPFFYPERPLRDANWLPIGTVLHNDLFWEVGGFNEQTPQGFEDWELWARCDKAGAQVVKVPDAVYRVHQGRQSSRNHATLFRRDQKAYMAEYHRVRRGIHPELYEAETVA